MPLRSVPAVLLACVFSLAPLYAASAPAEGEIIPLGRTLTLTSRILGEDREILVWQPPVEPSESGRYPVLYLLDAEHLFPMAAGVADFLVRTGRVPPLIIVGIVNVDRTRDLTPEPGPAELQKFPGAGHADRFLRFLQEELVPWVDRSYPTEPFRILAGHSHGGLFVLHALLQGASFGGYIATSPSLFWNGQSQVALLRERLDRPESIPGVSLFLSMGSERQEMMAGIRAWVELLQDHAPDRLDWHYEPLEGLDHEETPLPSLARGLERIWRATRDPGAIAQTGFLGYLRLLRERYGYEPPLSKGFLFRAGPVAQGRSCEDMADLMDYWARNRSEFFFRFTPDWIREGRDRLTAGESACAERMFRLLSRAGTKPLEALLGLGDALRVQGKIEAALQAYRDVLAVAPGSPDLRELVRSLEAQLQAGS